MSVLKAFLQASKKEKGKCHHYFEEVVDALHFTSYWTFAFHYGSLLEHLITLNHDKYNDNNFVFLIKFSECVWRLYHWVHYSQAVCIIRCVSAHLSVEIL